MSSTSTWGMATRSGSDGIRPWASKEDRKAPGFGVLWASKLVEEITADAQGCRCPHDAL